MKLAITGTIGSGKSTVSKIISELGYEVIDTDKLVHSFYEVDGLLYDWLINEFSDEILDENGLVDRAYLSEIVFSDREKLELLEMKVFKLVRTEIEEDVRPLVFYEVPLLFEAQLEDLFDFVVMVDASKKVRYERLRQRLGSFDNFKKRENRQLSGEVKASKSDFVIVNDGSLADLKLQVDEVLRGVLSG